MSEGLDVLARLESLPPAPLVLVRVMAIMENPEIGTEALVEAIEMDPGVTANLLRICNSPFYSRGTKLSTVQEAVHRLGTRALIQLVLMRETMPLLLGEHEGYGLAPGDLWRHSMSTALACRLLAQRVGHPRVPLVFTGGLLHDVGKLALDSFLHRRYQEVREQVVQGATFQEAERGVLGIEHAELGARIAENWAFPDSLVGMIRYHHNPEQATENGDLCALVHLGNSLSHWMGVGLGRPGLASRFESSTVRRFNLQPDDLDRILIDLMDRMEQTESAIAA